MFAISRARRGGRWRLIRRSEHSHKTLLAKAPDQDDPASLVIVDQFEELFTLCEDAARRQSFIEALLAVRGPVVIAVRADMYGKLTAHIDREITARPELIQIENCWRNAREQRPGAVQRGTSVRSRP